MGLVEDFRTERTKLIKTCILCLAYVTLGFGIAVIGPTMLDLSYLIGTTVSVLTWLLATRAIGTLISCLLTEYHKKYLGFEKILAISQFVMGVTLFILPFFGLIGMNIVIFIYGYAAGCFQVFGDLWTIRIWNKKKAAIYIQWVYFFFSLGAFVAPLVASPFLEPTTKSERDLPPPEYLAGSLQNSNLTNWNTTNSSGNSTGLIDEKPTIRHTVASTKIMYPYMISGAYAILISVVLYAIDVISSKKKDQKNGYKAIEDKDADEQATKDEADSGNSKPGPSNGANEKSSLLAKEDRHSESTSLVNSAEFRVPAASRPHFTLIKVLSVLFVNLFIGFDVTFGTYLSVYVFVNDDFSLSTQQGAFLTAAFWASYTFAFRLPGYWIIKNYGPNVLMNIEMLITFFSTILLSFLIGFNSIGLLWTSVILEGLGMSIVYSTYLAYLKTKFEPSAKLCSAFVCSFCFGSFIYPTVVGIWIEQYPIIFIYLSIFCCLFTTFIYVYVRHLFKKWQ